MASPWAQNPSPLKEMNFGFTSRLEYNSPVRFPFVGADRVLRLWFPKKTLEKMELICI
ncbi:hypothetical protein S1OALGB6SA_1454 [Olavius algarvensis spirochete endosymbiont]|nr:hypothetical protein S1OALGB6SA_1454 [Olavius algarvensis spirochete endosymbiont]